MKLIRREKIKLLIFFIIMMLTPTLGLLDEDYNDISGFFIVMLGFMTSLIGLTSPNANSFRKLRFAFLWVIMLFAQFGLLYYVLKTESFEDKEMVQSFSPFPVLGFVYFLFVRFTYKIILKREPIIIKLTGFGVGVNEAIMTVDGRKSDRFDNTFTMILYFGVITIIFLLLKLDLSFIYPLFD